MFTVWRNVSFLGVLTFVSAFRQTDDMNFFSVTNLPTKYFSNVSFYFLLYFKKAKIDFELFLQFFFSISCFFFTILKDDYSNSFSNLQFP